MERSRHQAASHLEAQQALATGVWRAWEQLDRPNRFANPRTNDFQTRLRAVDQLFERAHRSEDTGTRFPPLSVPESDGVADVPLPAVVCDGLGWISERSRESDHFDLELTSLEEGMSVAGFGNGSRVAGSSQHGILTFLSATEKVLHNALALPRDERSKVAAELSATLDEASDEGVDAAWAEEIHRRVARIRSGESEGVPAEDVHARIRAALRR